jgi:transcriptional regulator of aromatic amino acid metabolism
MWEHRNDTLHNDMTPAKVRELAALKVRIRQEFATGQVGLMPVDRPMLHDKARVLAMPLVLSRAWVRAMELARQAFRQQEQQSQADAHRAHQRTRLFMTRWMEGRPTNQGRAGPANVGNPDDPAPPDAPT